MRKTHGKKQTRKNKTKRRAIRGGVKGKGYSTSKKFGNPYKIYGNNTVYKRSKYNKDNNPSENNDKKDNTQSEVIKSAPESLQQTFEESS